LIDQFLHYHTNLRQDAYGKDPQGMSRFALQVTAACGERVGYDRVGIRLSPGAYLNEIQGDARDAEVFAYLLSELSCLHLAYVHTGNFDDSVQFPELGDKTMTQFIREHYQGQVMACGGYDLARAEQGVMANQFDLVAMGKPFIANPELIHKFEHHHELTAYESSMLETLN
jgi:N-ethylmaleimide reductase